MGEEMDFRKQLSIYQFTKTGHAAARFFAMYETTENCDFYQNLKSLRLEALIAAMLSSAMARTFSLGMRFSSSSTIL